MPEKDLTERAENENPQVLANVFRNGDPALGLLSTYVFFPEAETAVSRFVAQAQANPYAPALLWYGHTTSYRELDERSNRLAWRLYDLGIRKGDVVALYLDRSPDMIASVFAVLKCGGVYLPLDEGYPLRRLSFVLSDSNAKAVISDKPFPLPVTVPVLTPSAERSCDAPDVTLDGEDPAYLIYTSGTTGTPKGVVSLHKGLLNLLYSYEKIYSLTPADVVLQVASYTFDQSVWDIFGILAVGGRLALISHDDVRDPERIAAVCKQAGVTIASFTPAMIAELDPEAFPTLRILDTSGEAANATVLRRWVDRVTVINTYGPTEYTVNACSYVYTGAETNVPIGKPIFNTRFFVVKEDGSPCSVGEEGELCIAGTGLSAGYLNRPELTAEKFVLACDGVGEMYKTGDLVRILESGDLVFLRRIDTQVKVRGYRIEIGEVDAALRAIGVKDCYVCVKTVAGDNALAAYVVGETRSLRERLALALPSYMIPQYFVPVERIPRTLAGKTDESALPVPTQSREEKTEPATAREQLVASVWKELLDVPVCYREDDFFSLGGDSIKAIRLSAKLRNAGWYMSVRDILTERSLHRIAAAMTPLGDENDPLVTTDVEEAKAQFGDRMEKAYPLTPLQQGMLFHALRDDAPEYISQIVLKIDDIRPDLAEKALRVLFARYDVLRSAFFLTENGGMQVILKDREPFFTVCEGDVLDVARRDLTRGFDPEKDAMLRATYVIGEENHLVVSCHHLVADGWSNGILFEAFLSYCARLRSGEDLDALLAAAVREGKTSLAFSDFVRRLLRKDADKAKAKYEKLLRDFVGAYDYPSETSARPPIGIAAEKRIPLPCNVRREARRLSTTEATLLETAWGVTLGVKTGACDAVFGNVLSGRNEPMDGIETLVGMLISTVPVRVRFSSETTFRMLLRDVEKQNSDNLEYGFVPLTGKAAKIGSIIVFHNVGGATLSDRAIAQTDQTNYDVEIDVQDDGESFILRYNDKRYADAEAQALGEALSEALTFIVRSPDARVAEAFSVVAPTVVLSEPEPARTVSAQRLPLSTENERVVAEAMSVVLGAPVDDANADFLSLGGDSIKAIRLSARMRNLGYDVSVRTIMEYKTVRDVASRMRPSRSVVGAACGDVPLTPVMRDFFRRAYPHPDAYVMDLCLRVDATVEDLQKAISRLYEHHDLLRARYTGTGLTVPTLAQSSPPVVSDRKGDLVAECAHVKESVSLSSSLFAAARIEDGDKTYVYLCVHHLVTDGVSMRILVEDLLSLLAGNGLPQKSESFLSYAQKEVAAQLPEHTYAYVRSLFGKEKTRFPEGTETALRETAFDTAFTKRFLQCGGFCNAKSDDVLRTALARALSSLTGQTEIAVLQESHGRDRDGEDLTRTIGWFTAYRPLLAVGTGDPLDALIANKENALAVPSRGTTRALYETGLEPDVLFNYMGAYEEAGDVPVLFLPYENENPEREKLDCEAAIHNKRLTVSFRFNSVRTGFCDKLLAAFTTELTRLVRAAMNASPIPTPSDFGFPRMPLADLREILPYSPVRIAPLTPTQEGMLFHADDPRAYIEQTVTRVSVPLDPDTAKRAFAYLSEKYAVLRTHYVLTKSGNLYQYVTERADFPIEATADRKKTAKERLERGISPFGRVPVILDYQDDVVVITYHHVAFDLWSEGLLLEDLNAFLSGRATEAKEALPYADYVLSRRDALDHADAERWTEIARGLSPLSLPFRGTARISPAERALPEPDRAESFAKERDLPVNVALLAVTARFLQKACRRTDVSFAYAVSGRDATNERAVGLFIATLPIRVRKTAADEILAEVAEQARFALRAPSPIEETLRRAGQTAAPDVLFLFNNLEVKGRNALISLYDRNSFGVTVSVTKDDDGYALEIDPGEGSPEEANAYADLYVDCYREIFSLPREAFPVLIGKKAAHPATLNELFDLDREDFFVFDTERIDGREIFRKALSLSAHLREQPGDVVAVKIRDPLLKLVALYGVIFAGKAFLPVDPDAPVERERLMLGETGATLVLTDDVLANFSYGKERYFAAPSPDDAAYILYTSGSTGKPKGVRVSHNAIANRLVWMENAYPLGDGAILQKTPYTFDVSLWELFRPALFGGTLVTMRGSYASPLDVARRIREGNVTQIHFVPSSYKVFLEALAGRCPSGLQDVFLSGEKLSASLSKKHFASLPGVRLHNLYGPTECAVDVSYYDVTGEESVVPIGRPIDNVTLSVEYEGETLPPYAEGEIVVRGENVGLGYVGSEQGGFIDGAYRTGDIGYRDREGLLYYLRRQDDLVKLHGARVSLSEVENALTSVPGVSSAAVLVLGENGYLCAFYTGDNPDLETIVRQKLPAPLRPTRYVRLRAIPLTRSGKRDDEALRRLAEKTERARALYGERERVFLSLVSDALGKDVGFDDDLGQAGVSSLDRIRLAVRLSSLCSFGDVVRARTVRELCSGADRSHFLRFSSGASKALVFFPYAGGTGRIYENVRADGYDTYALVTATVDERDYPSVLDELRDLVARYDEVVVYAHCLGSLTAVRLLEDVPVTKAFFGAHVPDAVSSFFGRPVDGWKRASDARILAALQKGGLSQPTKDLAHFFRLDVRRAAILEAEKHKTGVPSVVLLSDADPFTPNLRVARSRWKKLLTGPFTVRVLRGRTHYFPSESDFAALLTALLSESGGSV